MRITILLFSLLLFSACGGGGGGGGGSPSFVHDINNVPTCSDTGTSYQTSEYNAMGGGSSSHGLGRVCASTAYANGVTGSGIKIAYLDSGIRISSNGNSDHQEFGVVGQSQSKVNIDPDSDPDTRTDVYRWDNHPNDEHGHGTHVAGIIAADKDSTGMHGLAYDATIIPIKILTPWGNDGAVQGRYTYAWGFYNSYAFGADILNNSWGAYETEIGTTCNSLSSCQSVANASYEDQYFFYQNVVKTGNIMMVWAAGNDGYSNPSFPNGICIYDDQIKENCVIVASLGTDGKIASYSNRCGIASNYCISAPGSSIVSSYNSSSSSYATASGTSMAAPLVSAGLALIKQKHTSLTHAQVIDRLFATAVDHDVYSQSSIYGHGLMDIGAATSSIGSLQLISPNSNNLDSHNSTYTELYENSFSSNSSFYSGLKKSLKNKTIEVYDSFDRANFLIYLDSFFQNKNIIDEYSASEHLDSLLHIDGDYSVNINENGTLKLYNSKSLNRFTFESNDKKIRFATNMQSNTFFDDSKKSMGFNSPKLTSKFFGNPYFYNDNDNISLEINNSFANSIFFVDEKLDNLAISINFQPTSKNYFDNNLIGDIEISLGGMLEKNKILNSFGTGSFNINSISNTKFASIKYKKEFEKINLIGNLNYGSTELKSNSYFLGNDSITTKSSSVGIIKNDFITKKNRISFLISQPQKVINGSIGLRVPTSSNNKREVNYTTYDLNLAPDATEINYDLLFARDINKNDSLYLNYTYIKNPIHNSSTSSINNVSFVFKKIF